MRRVLVPSAQLMNQSVPALVPTTPMSTLSSKLALTTAPSSTSSRSMNTELDLRVQGRRREERIAGLKADKSQLGPRLRQGLQHGILGPICALLVEKRKPVELGLLGPCPSSMAASEAQATPKPVPRRG